MRQRLQTCVLASALAIGSVQAQAQTAQDRAQNWTIYADSLASSNRDARDIDVFALTLSKSLKRNDPFTFGVQGGFLSASGRSTETEGRSYSSADAFAAYAGGFARLSPPNTARLTPFLEVGIAAMITDRSFPNDPRLNVFEGRIYGKFDARLGVDFKLSDSLEIEAALALNHISNGTGLGPQNINFDGAGLSFGVIQSW